MQKKQVAQLWQREPCDCGVLSLCPKSSSCSCWQLLYVRLALHRTCLFALWSQCFLKGLGHFWRIFDREGGITHQMSGN